MKMTGQQTRDKSNPTPTGHLRPTETKPGAGKEQVKIPPGKTWLWFTLILLGNYVLVSLLMPGPEEPVTVPYTLFKEEVANRNVKAIHSQGETITGRFASPVTYPKAGDVPPGGESQTANERGGDSRGASQTVTIFTTTLPSFVDRGLEAFLIDHKVEISAKPIQAGGSLWATLLFSFGPGLLFIGFYIWLFRRAAQQGGGIGAGLMGIGKSQARRYDREKDTRVTFDDVAGIDEAENELVEIVDFLRDTDKYTRLGGTAPKGVLLVGAPGTGKTLLAKAVAGEAGVPFFSMSAAEFVEMIVGVGAARVRDLFKEAREHAPAIIFIDELDSIGRARGRTAFGGLERTRADLESNSDRNGRFLEPGRHYRIGGNEPAGGPGQSAPATGSFRPAGRRESSRQDRARGDP